MQPVHAASDYAVNQGLCNTATIPKPDRCKECIAASSVGLHNTVCDCSQDMFYMSVSSTSLTQHAVLTRCSMSEVQHVCDMTHLRNVSETQNV